MLMPPTRMDQYRPYYQVHANSITVPVLIPTVQWQLFLAQRYWLDCLPQHVFLVIFRLDYLVGCRSASAQWIVEAMPVS